MFLTPIGTQRTHLFWREELVSPPLGAVGSLGLGALRPMMRRTFQRDLRVLAGLVRAHAQPSKV